MGFVFPLFLWALLLLAVPILIHLFYFRRFKKIYFSDIRFLKEVQEEKSTIEKLKKRLVLAARLLALFFLILAFVQPFIGKNNTQKQPENAAVAVYIDNSYSMGLKADGEAVLQIAKTKAKEIAEAYNDGDKFALLTNDLEGTHQRWMSKQDFLDVVEKVNLSPTIKTITEISKKEAALFQTVGNVNKAGFFISDFQKNMFSKSEDTGFIAHFLPINGVPEKNVYVDSCWFEQPVFTLNASNKLMVRIKNAGKASTDKMRISVKINDAVKAINDLTIPASSSVLDSFHFSITQAGWQRGEISFNDYPITFDDHFYFSFNVADKEKVVSIEDAETPNHVASVFTDDAHFQLERINKGQIDYSSLKKYALVVLNQLQDISSGLATTLKAYLENGGNLYIIPNTQPNIASYNACLSNINLATLGELQNKQGEVSTIHTSDVLFSGIFQQIPKNIEKPTFSKFFPILSGRNQNERVLLSTNLNLPFISKFESGNGLAYLQAVPMQKEFSNLASMAIFAPMLYNAAVYKKNNQALYYVIGQNNLIELKNEQTTSESNYKLSNGKHEFIPENRSIGNTTLLNVQTNLPNDGIYSILSDNKTVGMAAFNYDRTESSLEFAGKQDLASIYNQKNQLILDNTQANLAAEVKQIKDGVALWKLCVILSLFFLLIEILLIRYWK